MKKLIYTTLLAGCTLLCGCENDFDAKIYGVLSTTNFPATESDYEAYMMDCYVPFTINWGYSFGSAWQHNFYVPEGGLYRMLDFTSDTQSRYMGTWGTDWTNMSVANFETLKLVGRGSGGSPNHFEKIRDVTRFTKIIGDLEKADPGIFSGNRQKELIGEARLLRALMMYYLGQFYGPVPVIVDPELCSDAEALARLERPSLEDYTRYITEDLEYACANMVENQSEGGRYNADYARVVLMRHYLNEGYHVDGYYAKAAALKGQLTGHYSLYLGGQNPYAEQFYSANDGNVESIMAVQCTGSATGSGTQGNMNAFFYYAYPWACGSTAVNGQVEAIPSGVAGWDQIFAIDPAYFATFEDGDLRKETIITSYYNKNYDRIVDSNDLGDVWAGYFINKYPFDTPTSYQSNDIPLARWADVLLLHAEAVTRATGSVSAEAVAEINEIRHRAGLADLSADKTASAAAFLDAILEESGHETFCEGHRKTDLIRFGQYYTRLSAMGHTPSSEYIPLPDYAVDQAAESGYVLDQYFTTSNYDGPKK